MAGIFHSVSNILTGGAQNQIQGTAASMADPFASQRGQYQKQLSDIFANPANITKTPGYQFEFDQGMQALMRSEAASGNIGGKSMTDAISFGQNLAMTSFSNWENMLATLSGATTGSPAQAGSLYAGGAQMGGSALARLGGSLLGGNQPGGQGGLLGAIGNLFGGGGAAAGAADVGATDAGAADAVAAMAAMA